MQTSSTKTRARAHFRSTASHSAAHRVARRLLQLQIRLKRRDGAAAVTKPPQALGVRAAGGALCSNIPSLCVACTRVRGIITGDSAWPPHSHTASQELLPVPARIIKQEIRIEQKSSSQRTSLLRAMYAAWCPAASSQRPAAAASSPSRWLAAPAAAASPQRSAASRHLVRKVAAASRSPAFSRCSACRHNYRLGVGVSVGCGAPDRLVHSSFTL